MLIPISKPQHESAPPQVYFLTGTHKVIFHLKHFGGGLCPPPTDTYTERLICIQVFRQGSTVATCARNDNSPQQGIRIYSPGGGTTICKVVNLTIKGAYKSIGQSVNIIINNR